MHAGRGDASLLSFLRLVCASRLGGRSSYLIPQASAAYLIEWKPSPLPEVDIDNALVRDGSELATLADDLRSLHGAFDWAGI
jgi:hypothetical protein